MHQRHFMSLLHIEEIEPHDDNAAAGDCHAELQRDVPAKDLVPALDFQKAAVDLLVRPPAALYILSKMTNKVSIEEARVLCPDLHSDLEGEHHQAEFEVDLLNRCHAPDEPLKLQCVPDGLEKETIVLRQEAEVAKAGAHPVIDSGSLAFLEQDFEGLPNETVDRTRGVQQATYVAEANWLPPVLVMLIAGHETTAAVLTWTMYLLATNPEELKKAQKEVDAVVADPGGAPTVEEIRLLKNTRLALAESMRLYPAPPILIRRALEDVTLPEGGMGKQITLKKGTDCFIAVWNLHRSPDLWENPEAFDPSRFTRRFENPGIKGWNGFDPDAFTGLYPNEQSTDFAYVPFGGGQRRCAGDMFAMMEATSALSVLLKRFDWELACAPEEVEMITGATIHTKAGMPLKMTARRP